MAEAPSPRDRSSAKATAGFDPGVPCNAATVRLQFDFLGYSIRRIGALFETERSIILGRCLWRIQQAVRGRPQAGAPRRGCVLGACPPAVLHLAIKQSSHVYSAAGFFAFVLAMLLADADSNSELHPASDTTKSL